MSYTYKIATSAKAKQEGTLQHNLVDARHARNKVGHGYYIYVKINGKWRPALTIIKHTS
ncbi:MAG: hypothetical protein Q8M92_03260 [Candidatus Subteraquimicrobiales bacterium]|nr:hypothetical protein [Candidatus Subteraquimicrobiales bacterium]